MTDTERFSLLLGRAIDMKKNSIQWVSASDIGRAEYCPHYLEHKYKGTEVSASAKSARIMGEEAHEELNKIANDTRCYVATYLYGVDDPRTQQLRGFRDAYLRRFFLGRWFIRTYYFCSPLLVALCKKIPWLANFIERVVGAFVKSIARESRND